MPSETRGYASSRKGRRQVADGNLPAGRRPIQREIQFPIDPEQPQAHSVPDHVHREMVEIADRLGRLAHEAITDVLWRECGETLGAQARSVIAAEFLAARAERQQAFLESLGLEHREGTPPCYGPGGWTLKQEWHPHGPVFVIDGVCSPAGDVVAAWLDARAFHRAASVLQAVIRSIGPGNYTKPPADEWRRIWFGSRKGEPGVMAELLVGLRTGGEQVHSIDKEATTSS